MREHVVGTLAIRYDFLDVGSDMGWWIVDLIVRVPFRWMGIATRLIDLAFDKAASAAVSALNCLVESDNREAKDFWTCMGFQPRAIPGFHGHVEDESRSDKGRWVVMSKPVIGTFSQRLQQATPHEKT
jgi:GNAT superfamily N-acetyltransferase